MAPAIIDVSKADDWRDVVHRAVQALAEGRLVAFPTETVYGLAASALDDSAIERLQQAKGRKLGHPFTLALKSADEAHDYVPDMSTLARRLARRCWPGPITLVVDDSHPESLVRRLPQRAREAVSPEKTIGLRVPGHQIILDVLRMLAGPLALTSANRTGEPEATHAHQIAETLGGEVDLILDDGPCRFGQPSSVVRVVGNEFEILRAGVVPERTLRRLASAMILLVCTGNTCRSPMAELFCRAMLAERLGCGPEDLEDRGHLVISAGIAAMSGGGASPEAIEVMSELGLDLSSHETQPLTEPLVRHADLILTMTRSHREAIVAQWPEAADRTLVLAPEGVDISDPIGGPIDRYRRCAAQIQDALRERLEDMDLG